MVLNWPEIETRTFDFATFTRKEKPFSEAKQEYEKQVNELGIGWSAPDTMRRPWRKDLRRSTSAT